MVLTASSVPWFLLDGSLGPDHLDYFETGTLSAHDWMWLTAFALTIHVLYLAVRWRFLSKKLFPAGAASSKTRDAERAGGMIAAGTLQRALTSLDTALEAEITPASPTLLAAWRKATPHLKGLCEAAEPLLRQSMDSAQIDSVLLGSGGDYLKGLTPEQIAQIDDVRPALSARVSLREGNPQKALADVEIFLKRHSLDLPPVTEDAADGLFPP